MVEGIAIAGNNKPVTGCYDREGPCQQSGWVEAGPVLIGTGT